MREVKIDKSTFLNISSGMLRVSPPVPYPLNEPEIMSITNSEGDNISAFYLGRCIPEEMDLHFGDTYRIWNFVVSRSGEINSNIMETLKYLETKAIEDSKTSIAAKISKVGYSASKRLGFVVRESVEPDVFYITKRLY